MFCAYRVSNLNFDIYSKYIYPRFLSKLSINCSHPLNVVFDRNRKSLTTNIRSDYTRTTSKIISNWNSVHHKHFSLYAAIDSFIRAQTGLFKSLSESSAVQNTQNFLTYIHDYSHMPWWVTIILSTLFIRSVCTLPLAIYQHYILAKVENLKVQEMPGIVEQIKKEMHFAVRKYQWNETQARYIFQKSVKKQWNNLILRDNCHPAKSFLIVLIQLPLWVCLSVSYRNLVTGMPMDNPASLIACLEMTVGGFLWIPNLTIPDTSLILPVTFGLSNLAITEILALSRKEEPNRIQRFGRNCMRVVSVVMIPICSAMPSCMVLYWTTSSLHGLAQNLILLSPKFRSFCRIPQSPSQSLQPYLLISSNFKNQMSNILQKSS